ncbi:dipeptide ABC transporter ATP-binding protein [Trichothermofontia sp.]
MDSPLLQIENLRVAYPPTDRSVSPVTAANPDASIPWAVDGVSLTLQRGERLGLVGESGCGKSTLGRAVMRLLPRARIEGDIRFNGESVLAFTPDRLRRFRGEAIALVFQDPMTRLNPVLTIADHCVETLQAHRPNLSQRQAKTVALETLDAVKIPANRWTQYPHEFSGGMRQRVAIALALLLQPQLIVADEPTTSLDVTVSAQILQELTRLCSERDMGLLLISHDLALVGEYCDRLAVMYAGTLVELGPTATVLTQPQHDYTRSLLRAALHLQQGEKGGDLGSQAEPFDHHKGTKAHRREEGQRPLLRLEQVQKHYVIEPNLIERLLAKSPQVIKAVDGISLDLYPGEILGLVGESGCGKSTLSRTILQLIPPTAGRVEFLGQELTRLSPRSLRQQRRQMQMIFQDPHACLNPLLTVGESIADPLFIHQLATPEQAREQVLQMLTRVGLTPAEMFYDRYPGDLSGGQQQRVAIARALITQPKLLICDEPVSMLDASIQAQVLELMLSLKQEFDLTYLFITHDLWVARFLCDRIAVMQVGRIVEIGPTAAIFTQPQHPYTRTLLQAAPLLAKQLAL